MTPELFEEAYLNKVVRNKGHFFEIPVQEWFVTAALYEYYGDVSIFAVINGDDFFTLKIASDAFDTAMEDFEVVESSKG